MPERVQHLNSALVLDVGGTNTRLALAQSEGGSGKLLHTKIIPTPRGSLHGAIQTYLAEHDGPPLKAIAIAAAGRILRVPGRSWVRLTNSELSIEREELQAHFAVPHCWLVNDLAAVAAALPSLGEKHLRPLGGARGLVPGHRLVLGVGTGFGAAALTADGQLVETEAGHMSLAAVSASERQWLDKLAPLGRCSVEQVLSGPGLLRLHEVVGNQPVGSHEELQANWTKGDPATARTMSVFSKWLGRVAGDLVLAHGAWGGVVICGGVTERLREALDESAFRSGFDDKSPFTSDLAAVPVWTVTHSQPALLGLARLSLV